MRLLKRLLVCAMSGTLCALMTWGLIHIAGTPGMFLGWVLSVPLGMFIGSVTQEWVFE